jgi:hypothetical protein
MIKESTKVLLLACGMVGPATFAAQGPAEQYPTKPVRFIAPFPPGGTSDIIARTVAQKLSDGFGRQFIVDNRGGATGTIGYDLASKAPPDGYTLLLSSMGGMVTNQFLYKRLPYDPINDFIHISQLATAGQVLVIHPSVQAKTAPDLVSLAKSKPGGLTVGSGGIGTTQHIVAEVFQNATGTKMTHVPYKGSVLAVGATVAGRDQHDLRRHGARRSARESGPTARARGEQRAALQRVARRPDHGGSGDQGLVSTDVVGNVSAERHACGDRQAPERRSREGHEIAGRGGEIRQPRPHPASQHAGAHCGARQDGDAADGPGHQERRHQAGMTG